MTVRLVEELPIGLPVNRTGRTLALIIAVPLVLCGLCCGFYSIFGVTMFSAGALSGGALSNDQLGGDEAVLALLTAISFSAAWAGMRMIRGRRPLGLYLRKFRFTASTETVSHALSSVVGRSLRLVTLDGGKLEGTDQDEVAAIGAGTGRRRLVGALAVVTPIILGCTIVYAFIAVRKVFKTGGAPLSSNPAGEMIASSLLELSFFILLASPALVIISVMAGGAFRAARRMERGAKTELTEPLAVAAEARKVGRAAKRVIAARLTVLKVDDSFWERAVYGLAAVSDIVVIDVSDPTKYLLWEVRNIKPLFDGRCVLVGARDKVAQLTTAAADTIAGELARLLEHDSILVYGPEAADRKRFTRALRRAIEQPRMLAPTGSFTARP